MRCPYCNHNDSKVTDSRERDNGEAIWRRRLCLKCEKKFSTFERVERIPVIIVKRDGKKELYHREKMIGGILRATKKRPVANERIEEIADDIESILRGRQDEEIPTSLIGELIMEKLKDIDLVSYIRFASVYKEFSDIGDFVSEIERFIKLNKGRTQDE